jgi:hypothetical protein
MTDRSQRTQIHTGEHREQRCRQQLDEVVRHGVLGPVVAADALLTVGPGLAVSAGPDRCRPRP